MKSRGLLFSMLILFCIFLSSACVQRMGTGGHLRPMDGRKSLMRISGRPPEGTVPQSGAGVVESPLAPPPRTLALLKRGQEMFNANCVPCHGPLGYGDGMVVQRGFLPPPSYHIERLRSASDQHFYDVITQGYGAMYSYADRVTPDDRWAIIAYIRALQLSQNTKISELPADDRQKVENTSQQAGEAGS
jgi:mono/diheme cytochrome c family protein